MLYKVNDFDRPEEPDKIIMFCNKDSRDADVRIPPDTTIVFPYAFENCRQLTHLSFPKSVCYIGEGAFEGCCALREMRIPEQVTGVEPFTFSGCTSLRRLNLGERVKYMGKGILRGCSQDMEIYLPNQPVFVSDYLYDDCKCKITLSMGPNCDMCGFDDIFFHGHIVGYKVCNELEAVGPEGARWDELGCCTYYGFWVNEDGSVCARNRELGSISLVKAPTEPAIYDIPRTCSHLARGAILYCLELEYLYIPDSVTHFDIEAIHACPRLRTVRFPEHAWIMQRDDDDEKTLVIKPVDIGEARRIVNNCLNLSEIIIGRKAYPAKDKRR